jgi:hypothetical protein
MRAGSPRATCWGWCPHRILAHWSETRSARGCLCLFKNVKPLSYPFPSFQPSFASSPVGKSPPLPLFLSNQFPCITRFWPSRPSFCPASPLRSLPPPAVADRWSPHVIPLLPTEPEPDSSRSLGCVRVCPVHAIPSMARTSRPSPGLFKVPSPPVRGVPKTLSTPCPAPLKLETLGWLPPSISAVAAAKSPRRPPSEPQGGEESLGAARRRSRASNRPRLLAVVAPPLCSARQARCRLCRTVRAALVAFLLPRATS